MSRGHGIMLIDVIPALVRRPTKEDIYPSEPCASAGGNMSERHGIMLIDKLPAMYKERRHVPMNCIGGGAIGRATWRSSRIYIKKIGL